MGQKIQSETDLWKTSMRDVFPLVVRECGHALAEAASEAPDMEMTKAEFLEQGAEMQLEYLNEVILEHDSDHPRRESGPEDTEIVEARIAYAGWLRALEQLVE
jgi:hypothetical protein